MHFVSTARQVHYYIAPGFVRQAETFLRAVEANNESTVDTGALWLGTHAHCQNGELVALDTKEQLVVAVQEACGFSQRALGRKKLNTFVRVLCGSKTKESHSFKVGKGRGDVDR